MIRAFTEDDFTATIHRAAKADQAGTDDPLVTFAAVAGMSGFEVVLQPLSASKVPTELGMVFGLSFRMELDADQLAAGTIIQDGDRAVMSNGDTYTVNEALLIKNQTGRRWSCYVSKQTCAGQA